MNVIELGQSVAGIQSKLEKSPTGVSFVSLEYTSKKSGEIAKHLINVGSSLDNAKAKDIKTLEETSIESIDMEILLKYGTKKSSALYQFTIKDKSFRLAEIKKAIDALLKSLISPSKSRSEGQKDAYVPLCKGFRLHKESGNIHIFGMTVSKTIIQEGEYPKVNSRLQTLLKNHVKKNHMKSTKFRTFIINNSTNMK